MPKFQPPTSPDVVGNSLSTQVSNVLQKPGGEVAPAAVVGTAISGPAFVPFDIANSSDFESVFGTLENAVDDKHYGMLAANQYFANGGDSVVYFRTLGAGDCKSRLTAGNNPGSVNNAGFVVGQEIINTGTNLIGPNTYAGSTATNPGVLGRAYFLVAFMSESAGSTYLSDAGIQTVGQNTAAPIIRGMLFAPSGVVLSLSSNLEPNNTPTSIAAYGSFGAAGDGGCNIGTVVSSFGASTFTLLLNGHITTGEYPSTILSSLDPTSTYQDLIEGSLTPSDLNLPINKGPEDSLYFAEVFNTDPTKIQEAGHYLHLHYDVYPDFAVVTGSGVITAAAWPDGEPSVLLLTSSLTRNTGSTTDISADTIGVPNFENYQNRFTQAFSPFVVSQKINGTRFDLFKLHAFSDGKLRQNLKFVVSNIEPNATPNGWAKFDIDVYDTATREDEPPPSLVKFEDITLDPTSDDFITRKIGDTHVYYDFDAASGAQKTVVEGGEPLTNQFVRVEVTQQLLDGELPNTVLPVGFRGIYHLVTSGSSVSSAGSILTGSFSSDATNTSGISTDTLQRVTQPPLPMRERISIGISGLQRLRRKPGLVWGIQYSRKDQNDNPSNKTAINLPKTLPLKRDASVENLLAYFPDFHTVSQNAWVGDNAGVLDVGGCVLDADRFNRNLFTLENVAVITGSVTNGRSVLLPDPREWSAAIYVRNGQKPAGLNRSNATEFSDKVRFIDPNTDFADTTSRQYLRFAVPMQGGFNGLNIFDDEADRMTDVAVFRERFDPNLDGPTQSTTAAYLKSIDILSEKSEADMQLLSIPGIRHKAVTNVAVQSSEEKFNVLFVADVEEFDAAGNYVTSSLQDPDLTQTINNFDGRSLGSSFAAGYFPNVSIDFGDEAGGILETPPSVGVLGAIALNDSLAGPYTSPMGYTRGRISGATSTKIDLSEKIDRDRLIAANINPIVSDVTPLASICPVSQKTTLGQVSGFSRVNIRRMMIDVRRRVRNIAREYLFEPANAFTARQFQSDVQSLLASLVVNGAIEDYRVSIDQTSFVGSQRPISNNVQVNVGKFRPLGDLLNQQRNAETELKTIRASVFIQPIQSEEIIQLDIDESVEDS
jgi:hypothetical protein